VKELVPYIDPESAGLVDVLPDVPVDCPGRPTVVVVVTYMTLVRALQVDGENTAAKSRPRRAGGGYGEGSAGGSSSVEDELVDAELVVAEEELVTELVGIGEVNI
jgi:hypothetical protein